MPSVTRSSSMMTLTLCRDTLAGWKQLKDTLAGLMILKMKDTWAVWTLQEQLKDTQAGWKQLKDTWAGLMILKMKNTWAGPTRQRLQDTWAGQRRKATQKLSVTKSLRLKLL